MGVGFDPEILSEIELPYFYSKIDVSDYFMLPSHGHGSFMANWQDERTPGFVSVDGLLDDSGRSKTGMYQLANHWKGAALPSPLPRLKILPPATSTNENQAVTYQILIRDGENWRLLKEHEGLTFDWKLIKTNQYGEPLETTPIGNGVDVTIVVPKAPMNYKIALYASDGSRVGISQSDLNTPLHQTQWTEEAWSSFELSELSNQRQ